MCFILCPHQDSNLDRRFRKPLFYPLNYESELGKLYCNRWVYCSGNYSVKFCGVGELAVIVTWLWGKYKFCEKTSDPLLRSEQKPKLNKLVFRW